MELSTTAGTEDYDRLRPLGYPQTDVFLILIPLANMRCRNSVKTLWMPEIQHHNGEGAPIYLISVRGGSEGLDDRRINQHVKSDKNFAWSIGVSKHLEVDLTDQSTVTDAFKEVSTGF